MSLNNKLIGILYTIISGKKLPVKQYTHILYTWGFKYANIRAILGVWINPHTHIFKKTILLLPFQNRRDREQFLK